MAGSEQPLLSARPSSERSNDQADAQEDALLISELSARNRRRRGWRYWRDIGVFTWAFLATIVIIILSVLYQRQQAQHPTSRPNGKRNLIFMVSDGMGPTSLSLTRSWMQAADGLPFDAALHLDPLLIGQSRTRSTSSLITDSAAGATAFSCGKKSYNGAIAVLPDHTPCGTVLEAAKKAGYMTGLVVTTRITDATPACFAAHVNVRSEEDRIAEQLIGDYPLGRVVDLMLGGGRCHFLPQGVDGSCREDSKDIVQMAKERGFHYADNRTQFDMLSSGGPLQLPFLGLFAEYDIPYEVDRRFENDAYPSLEELTRVALKTMEDATKGHDKGFFLMIEGSRIDHAGHANDPVAQVHEVLIYDKAIKAVTEFLGNSKTPGVMVSTSDHETGGVAVARQLHETYPEYLWYPGVLANASQSAEKLGRDYHNYLQTVGSTSKDIEAYLRRLVSDGLGVHDASDAEIQSLIDRPQVSPYLFADIVSRRAQTGWSTHGHSAADVNIYASSPQDAAALIGNHENTEIGEFLRNYLDVDVDSITKELKEKGTSFDVLDAGGERVSWMGKMPEEGERLDGQDHVDHYTGDFKKHRRCDTCGM